MASLKIYLVCLEIFRPADEHQCQHLFRVSPTDEWSSGVLEPATLIISTRSSTLPRSHGLVVNLGSLPDISSKKVKCKVFRLLNLRFWGRLDVHTAKFSETPLEMAYVLFLYPSSNWYLLTIRSLLLQPKIKINWTEVSKLITQMCMLICGCDITFVYIRKQTSPANKYFATFWFMILLQVFTSLTDNTLLEQAQCCYFPISVSSKYHVIHFIY